MSFDTYDNLKLEVIDYLDRDDLTNKVEGFISLAEARHRRDFRLREMLVRDCLDIEDRYVEVPERYLQTEVMRLLTDPVRLIKEVNVTQMTNLRVEQSCRPTKFTIHSEIEFDSMPDQFYEAEIIFYQSVEPLSSDNQSNAILELAPDAYLYGALAASAPFLMHDERIQLWEALYKQAKDGENASSLKGKHSGNMVARVAGSTP